jgi:hypothetical protein
MPLRISNFGHSGKWLLHCADRGVMVLKIPNQAGEIETGKRPTERF